MPDQNNSNNGGNRTPPPIPPRPGTNNQNPPPIPPRPGVQNGRVPPPIPTGPSNRNNVNQNSQPVRPKPIANQVPPPLPAREPAPVWIVSSHGGASTPSHVTDKKANVLGAPQTIVPKGMTFITFEKLGEVFEGGNPELDQFIAGNEKSPIIQERIKKGDTVTEGYPVPNYTAFGTNDFRSGIYQLGNRNVVVPLRHGTTMRLSEIFSLAQQKGITKIYWLACLVREK